MQQFSQCIKLAKLFWFMDFIHLQLVLLFVLMYDVDEAKNVN